MHVRVEGSHGLGKLGGANLGGEVVADARPGSAQHHQLPVGADVCGVHVGEGGGQSGHDAAHADRNAQTSSLL